MLGEAGPVVPCVCMACLCHARPLLSAPVHVIQNQRLKVSLLEQRRSCHEHRFNVFTHKNSPKVGHAACPLRTPPCPLLSGVALTRFQMCLRHSALRQVSLEAPLLLKFKGRSCHQLSEGVQRIAVSAAELRQRRKQRRMFRL